MIKVGMRQKDEIDVWQLIKPKSRRSQALRAYGNTW
jgi:hypothetical protein